MTTPAAEPRTTPEDSRSPISPPTSSIKGVKAPLLGVRPTPSTITASEPLPSPAGASAGELRDPLDDLASTATHSASPDPDAEPLKVPKKPLAEILAGGVVFTTERAHAILARTELEQDEGVWLLKDEDEARAIAKPVAALIERRVGSGQMVSGDVNDVLALAAALGGYLARNLVRAVQLRRVARRMHSLGITDPDTQEAA